MPARITWAVELLAVAPADVVLEVGCGAGVAAALVADRLTSGHLTAIDRSPRAIARTAARVAGHVAAGRVTVVRTDLAGFSAAGRRFDKAFAVDVNVFWAGDAGPACAALLAALRPGGTVRLVHAGPSPGRAGDVAARAGAALGAHGFATALGRHPGGTMTCVTGRAPDAPDGRW